MNCKCTSLMLAAARVIGCTPVDAEIAGAAGQWMLEDRIAPQLGTSRPPGRQLCFPVASTDHLSELNFLEGVFALGFAMDEDFFCGDGSSG